MIGTIVVYSLLSAAIAIGSLVSLSIEPRIRGWRNLALLSSLILGIVSPFVAGWYVAGLVWLSCAIISALMYKCNDMWTRRRHPPEDDEADDPPQPIVSLFINGLFVWPLLFLEAFEYTCAELFPPSANPEDDGEDAQR